MCRRTLEWVHLKNLSQNLMSLWDECKAFDFCYCMQQVDDPSVLAGSSALCLFSGVVDSNEEALVFMLCHCQSHNKKNISTQWKVLWVVMGGWGSKKRWCTNLPALNIKQAVGIQSLSGAPMVGSHFQGHTENSQMADTWQHVNIVNSGQASSNQ